MGIPEGRCSKCGSIYHGWALLNPRNQYCSKCGTGLDIKSSDGTIFKGYSPFDADGDLLNPPKQVTDTDESANISRQKDKGSGVNRK